MQPDDADPYSHPELGQTSSWMKYAIVGVCAIAVVGLVVFTARALMTEGKTVRRQVVQVAIFKPPPPPPPPKPEEKPPEPELKKEVEVPKPDTPPEPQEADAPPPGEDLGLDADGSGSGDGFGLAARKGGREITTIGGGGDARAQFAWFTGLVQSRLQEQLSKSEKLRSTNYKVIVRVWFNADGTLERFELVDTSGNAEIDQNIKLAMQDLPKLKQPPPAEMPQPVKLRVTSRGAG